MKTLYWVLLSLLCYGFLGYGLLFVVLQTDLAWHLETAARRLTFQLVPAAAVLLAALARLVAATSPREES